MVEVEEYMLVPVEEEEEKVIESVVEGYHPSFNKDWHVSCK